jgi:hypothetical protein
LYASSIITKYRGIQKNRSVIQYMGASSHGVCKLLRYRNSRVSHSIIFSIMDST